MSEELENIEEGTEAEAEVEEVSEATVEECVSRCDSDACEEQTEGSTDEVGNALSAPAPTAQEQETPCEKEKEEKPAKKTKKEKKDDEEGKGRVIVITSGKGGVGKTTTSANIGTALAKGGNKVVLIDTDIGLRNLDLLLGLENRIVYTIVDVVEERCKLKQALVKDKKNANLCLLAAAQTRDKSAVSAQQLQDICWELKKEFDFILLDCPAGIEQGFQNATAGAKEAIVVTTPEMSAIRDADRIIGLLEAKEEIEKYHLLVNRVRPSLVKNQDMMSVEDVVEILRAELIGVIPEDTGVITSTNKGEPIVNDEKSLAGTAYKNVARRILGEEVPFLDINEPKNIVEKIKKFFSKKAGAKQ